MTEYGRGPGPEPWHPEDPLYGDQGWRGQQAADGQGPYGGGHPQYYPQQPQQPQYGGAGQDPHLQQQHHYQQQFYGDGGNGGWDGTQAPGAAYSTHPTDLYAQPHGGGYGAEHHDYYGTADAYPPPEPPDRRAYPQAPVPEHQQGWQPASAEEPEQHAFFADADNRDDESQDEGPRSSRRAGRDHDGRGKGGGQKPRSGLACLIVAVILVGGVSGIGYVGYQFYQDRFAPAPDFEGSGAGAVMVEIPDKASLAEIGRILKGKGVVKSVDAFTIAAAQNSKSQSIQAGVYTLKKQMSASAAIEFMLHPKSLSNFIIREGLRSSEIYTLIDKRLGLDEGTTEKVAEKKAKDLGLPEWADDSADIKDPLEGFLFPAAYSVSDGEKPEQILKEMVARANKEYAQYDLEAKAQELGLASPLQVVTVASIVQAEGKYKHDFDKVARVIYNRLKLDNQETFGLLDMDSTFNYAKNQSTLDIGSVNNLRQFNDPYNTYKIKGLPPGPIDNPGLEALKSALDPADGPWYYFVSINEDKTLFAVTNEEHERNRDIYEKEREKSGQ